MRALVLRLMPDSPVLRAGCAELEYKSPPGPLLLYKAGGNKHRRSREQFYTAGSDDSAGVEDIAHSAGLHTAY